MIIALPSVSRCNHTEQQHLNLIPLQHLVALELVLNLLVPRLPLLILSAHATTHDGGRTGSV